MNKTLIILCGLEGSGKSTLTKALLPHLKNGAAFDAETILQVNPFEFNETFQNLAISHAADLIFNFYEHGFDTVVAASFINDRFWYDRFRTLLPGLYNIYLIHEQIESSCVQFLQSMESERQKPFLPQ